MNRWKTVLPLVVLTGCTSDIGAPTGGAAGMPMTPGSAAGAGAPGRGGTGGSTGGAAAGTGAGAGASAGAGTAGASSCTPGVPATSQIPRLTNAQYDRTVRDLLGVSALTAQNGSTPSNLLATDQAGGLTDLGWSAYKTVGEAIAAQVMGDPTLRANFITCDPAVGTCLHDTVVGFGRKAFRRPLSTEELQAFDVLIAAGPEITPTGAPAEVAQAVLVAFLVSPAFLQREELDETSDGAGHYALSQHELAARLSYLLWGSTPDDVLNQAADEQKLETPDQLLGQARRMLDDPKARDMVAAFHRSYLRIGTNTRWDNTNHDSTAFPAFNKGLVGALQQETELFFDAVVFAKQGSFQDLLQSPLAFVSSATAPLYGLDAAKFTTELTETTLGADRPGFLTRLGFLNAYSDYASSSPILRGAFITKEVLGIVIGAPPPGASQTALPEATAALDTHRKRIDAMTSGAACAGCHLPFINPPGFALESFDAVGSSQTVERDTGAPIDTAAEIMLDADGEPVQVSGAAELMARIATAPGAQARYASKWVSYATGRESDPADACAVQQLAAKMQTAGYTVLNLIVDLTQTEAFRVRTVEP